MSYEKNAKRQCVTKVEASYLYPRGRDRDRGDGGLEINLNSYTSPINSIYLIMDR